MKPESVKISVISDLGTLLSDLSLRKTSSNPLSRAAAGVSCFLLETVWGAGVRADSTGCQPDDAQQPDLDKGG